MEIHKCGSTRDASAEIDPHCQNQTVPTRYREPVPAYHLEDKAKKKMYINFKPRQRIGSYCSFSVSVLIYLLQNNIWFIIFVMDQKG